MKSFQDFRFGTDTIFTVIDSIVRSPFTSPDGCDSIYFRPIQGSYAGYGSGANRQVYQKLSFDIVESGIMIQTGYFAEINPVHPFWSGPDRVKALCWLLNWLPYNACQLPFHLSPSLLEVITVKSMSDADLAFYAEKIDPTTYKAISDSDIAALDLGLDSKADAYRHTCKLDLHNPAVLAIHQIWRENSRFSQRSIQDADLLLSGEYIITPAMVQSIFRVSGTTAQAALWRDFIESLTDAEIRSMLRIFGNTIQLNITYYVYIEDIGRHHLRLSSCYQRIVIHPDLFQSIDTLSNLKMYFEAGDDKIRG